MIHPSNGLDIERAVSDEQYGKELVALVNELFLVLFALACPTVAVVTGHAFAAGFMLALCHDHRIMRADRVRLHALHGDVM